MPGRGVRRHGVRRADDAGRSATAARCSCSRDIVDFQRQGWKPRRSWPGSRRCCRRTSGCTSRRSRTSPRSARRFVLQGGTQYNLAAVKAQVDFIESRFAGTERQPEVDRARALRRGGRDRRGARGGPARATTGARRTFIGLDAVPAHHVQDARATRTRAATSARTSACARSSTSMSTGAEGRPPQARRRAIEGRRCEAGRARLIIATCEKGTVEDVDDMRAHQGRPRRASRSEPELRRDRGARGVQACRDPAERGRPGSRKRAGPRPRDGARELMQERAKRSASASRACSTCTRSRRSSPATSRALGVAAQNIVFSDYTSEELYKEGAKRGAIDPCFPSKLALAARAQPAARASTAKKPLDCIFFPMIDVLPTRFSTLAGQQRLSDRRRTPRGGQGGLHQGRRPVRGEGRRRTSTRFVNLADPHAVRAADVRGVGAAARAVAGGERAGASTRASRRSTDFERSIRAAGARGARRSSSARTASASWCSAGRTTTTRAQPRDPGGVPEARLSGLHAEHAADRRRHARAAVRRRGAGRRSSATRSTSGRLEELATRRAPTARSGRRSSRRGTRTWWRSSCRASSAATTRRSTRWSRRSSRRSGTPYFCFKDIDENKPTGSIKIRVETIDYFLKRYREETARQGPPRRADRPVDCRLREAAARQTSVRRHQTARRTPRSRHFPADRQTPSKEATRRRRQPPGWRLLTGSTTTRRSRRAAHNGGFDAAPARAVSGAARAGVPPRTQTPRR